MANVLINDTYLKAIGEAIRSKLGTVLKYKPSEMATAINNIQTLKGGGYKVNITQSEHQTITVSQPSFNNRTAGFTIDDYPTINVSLKADPGYTAGSLNLTNFTFSNDVREVNIFATEATYSPNITYNGNMNVFVCTSNLGSMFNITTGTKKDTINNVTDYAYNEAFTLTLAADGDRSYESLVVNYKDNFYNLDPNANYKITAIKIGDTSLSETDISDGSPEISSTTSGAATYINADLSKDWVKSVYKQCTGKRLELSYADVSPIDIDYFIQDGTPHDAKDAYIGEQIANTIFLTESKPATNKFVLKIDTEPYHDVPFLNFYYSLSEDERKKYDEDRTAFVNKFNSKSPGFRDGNLVQAYYSKLQEIMQKHTGDETALNVLKKYNPATNSDFVSSGFTNPNPDIFSMTYYIDPSDKYGFLASLPGGYAYVEWLFFVRYVVAEEIMTNTNNETAGFVPIFEPADPIISTIPVSITFTKVTQ